MSAPTRFEDVHWGISGCRFCDRDADLWHERLGAICCEHADEYLELTLANEANPHPAPLDGWQWLALRFGE